MLCQLWRWGVCNYYRTMGLISISGLLFLGVAHAGDKIHFTESPEKVDVPKPNTRDDRISSRFGNRVAPGEEVGPPIELAPTGNQPTATPLMSRKLEEYFDKKRNWMFIDPKDNTKLDDSFDSSQGLSSDNLLLDNDKKTKTVQEKFYEHSNEKPDARKKKKTGEDDSDSTDTNSDRDSDRKTGLDGNRLAPELSLGNLLRLANRNDAELRDLNDMSRLRPLGGFANDPSDSIRKVEREREIKQHDSDFAQIIAPRSGGPTISAVVDPVNTQGDITRREVNPFAPANNFGNYKSGLTDRSDTSPSFAVNSNLPRPENVEGLASSLPTAPSFSSTPAISSPSPSSFTADRQPSVFQPPRRKF